MSLTVLALLAAGGGARFDGPTHKLRAPFRSATVVEHSLAAALDSHLGPVAIVWGAVGLADLCPASVTMLHNPDWSHGQATSIQMAVAWATALDATSLVIGLGDQPGRTADCWRAVAAATAGPIVGCGDRTLFTPPVRLDREVWGLLPKGGDEGARALVRDHPTLVHTVICNGQPDDVDTVEDLSQWT